MTVFWRLLFGHLLADFTFQTDYIARWKQKSLWGMLSHCGLHLLFYAILCWPFLGEPWVRSDAVRLNGWVCIGILFLLHFLEDEWRVFMIRQKRLKDGMGFFLFDQSVHLLCLSALLPAGLLSRGDGVFSESWPLLGCLAVLAAHGTTVLLYYFEKDMFSTPFPEFDEKYYTISERVIFAVCFLLPGFWGFVVPGVWGVIVYRARLSLGLDYSWFGFYVGGGAAAACGLAARWLAG